jgi:hypothetical protein
VREEGWTDRVGVPVLDAEQVARRAAWLSAAVRDGRGLPVEAGEDRMRLAFEGPAQAEYFSRALLAENVPTTVDGCRVELRVESWFSPSDVLSLALAVTKVTHYLKV